MHTIDTHETQSKQNQQNDFEQWLTAQLHDCQPYLDDNGFSDQVMAALPASAGSTQLRPLVWATLLALGCAMIILGLFPGWAVLLNLLSSLLISLLTLPLLTLLQIGLGLGLGITSLGALVIWREA